MPFDNSWESPKLERLSQAIAGGNSSALKVFWNEIQAAGAPLVESIQGDDEYSLVTFLWRGEQVDGVDLVSMMTTSANRQMSHLDGTDLWYLTIRLQNNLRATYQFTPYDDEDLNPDNNSYGSGWDKWQPDPFNPNTFAFYDENEDPTGVKLVRSVLEMPAANEQPWGVPHKGRPKGKLTLHTFHSKILDNERRVWVYTPPGYSSNHNESFGLVIFFDGWSYLKLMPTTTIMDNLMVAREIYPSVCVFVDSLSMIIRLRELILYKPFNDFLTQELMPWIHEQHYITSDPSKIVVAGASAGGLAAGYAALEHPHIFGKVLSQSGAFSFSPQGDPEHEWLARQYVERDQTPVNFYLDAGLLEVNSLRDRGVEPSLLVANRHLRDILRVKGHRVDYHEFPGGHDYISWRGTLPMGLQALTGLKD